MVLFKLKSGTQLSHRSGLLAFTSRFWIVSSFSPNAIRFSCVIHPKTGLIYLIACDEYRTTFAHTHEYLSACIVGTIRIRADWRMIRQHIDVSITGNVLLSQLYLRKSWVLYLALSWCAHSVFEHFTIERTYFVAHHLQQQPPQQPPQFSSIQQRTFYFRLIKMTINIGWKSVC